MNEDTEYKNPHGFRDLYNEAMLLLCDTCGYWEIVSDECCQGGDQCHHTIPCICPVCEHGTYDIVLDDSALIQIKSEKERRKPSVWGKLWLALWAAWKG